MLFDWLSRVHALYHYSYGIGGTFLGITLSGLFHTYKVSPFYSLILALGVAGLFIALCFHNRAIQSIRHARTSIIRSMHRENHEHGRGK